MPFKAGLQITQAKPFSSKHNVKQDKLCFRKRPSDRPSCPSPPPSTTWSLWSLRKDISQCRIIFVLVKMMHFNMAATIS